MAKPELIEPTEQTPAKPVSAKDRYTELLSLVQAKIHMVMQTPGSVAEFPEFAELIGFAEKLS